MSGGRSNLLPFTLPRAAAGPPLVSEEAPNLRGSLSVMSVLDLLQWLCTSRTTWKVRLYGQGVDGDVTVVQGQLIDARWGLERGAPALCSIVGCHFGCFDLVTVNHVAEGTLRGNSQALLLNAVRDLDERNHRILEHAKLDASPSHNPPPLDTAVSGERALPAVTLIDLGFTALRSGNTAEAERLWNEALLIDPDNRSLQFNLRKLSERDPLVR